MEFWWDAGLVMKPRWMLSSFLAMGWGQTPQQLPQAFLLLVQQGLAHLRLQVKRSRQLACKRVGGIGLHITPTCIRKIS